MVCLERETARQECIARSDAVSCVLCARVLCARTGGAVDHHVGAHDLICNGGEHLAGECFLHEAEDRAGEKVDGCPGGDRDAGERLVGHVSNGVATDDARDGAAAIADDDLWQ